MKLSKTVCSNLPPPPPPPPKTKHSVLTLLGIYSAASAAVTYPLRHLTLCLVRDALLHTTAVMCGYLCYCHRPVSFDQSGSSPLTSLINKAELLLTGCFLHHSLQTENPRRSTVSEILKPPCLAPTIIPRSKSV